MKAVEAMFWMLLFNVSIALIGGLEIFGGIEAGPFISYEDMTGTGTSAIFAFAIIWGPLLAGAIAGAISGFVGIKFKTSDAAAYSALGTLLTITFVNTTLIFTDLIGSIGNAEARAAVTALVFIFLAITGLLFALGLIQLIRGGFQSAM